MNSIIQQVVSDELWERVISLQTLVSIGIMPFAGLLIIKIIDPVGMPRDLIGAAVCYGPGAGMLFRRLSGDNVKEAPHA